MSTTFARLGLPQPIVTTLAKRGITEPFPIQAATIPDGLAGRDIAGKAPTGSGKTLAFGLPLLVRVAEAAPHRPRGLVLAPTRELAEQIKHELAPLARAADRRVTAVYGGVRYNGQKNAMRKGVDVLVATPGRLEDLIEQRIVDLSQADFVVVDEADRMADMGFMPAVRRILDQTSRKRQTLLFSATLDGDIAVLTRDYQRDPVRHEVEVVEAETVAASHHFWLVEHQDRIRHTADLVSATGRSIVFTRTRHGADRLSRQLDKLGVPTVALHGGRSQNQRNRALAAFADGSVQALIATDVAARGIHVDAVDSVIHYDPPNDHKDYVHRSGRTARAGAGGTVISLVTGQQKRSVQKMQRMLDLRSPIGSPRIEDVIDGETIRDMSETTRRNGKEASRNGHKASRRESPGAPRNGHKESRRESPGRPKRSNGDARPDTRSSQSIYVANLPWSVGEKDLYEIFGRYGTVHSTTVITDKKSGRSRGFGFVDMPRPAARAAIDGLHGSELNGRDLTVRFAQPSKYHD